MIFLTLGNDKHVSWSLTSLMKIDKDLDYVTNKLISNMWLDALVMES